MAVNTSKNRWIVTLGTPMVVGFGFGDGGRQEVIDKLILEYLPAGSQAPDESIVYNLMKSIDWSRSERVELEELEACDIHGALRRAQADARARAEAFVKWQRPFQAAGVDSSHGALFAAAKAAEARETTDE